MKLIVNVQQVNDFCLLLVHEVFITDQSTIFVHRTGHKIIHIFYN
jgi:hypothetical protein